ncbi:MAG: quinoprotein dehydrogenase-associated SoxYZ-like carrier [Rhodospirillales bacterium]|jgi:sulfur-oxidizing protein SoxY|nr:quinoprotein dehydrogenase-associated SoxYZ-like carrier [Rhodospirillales bacterium]
MRKLLLCALLCGAALAPWTSARAGQDEAAIRAQRWQQLRHAIFGNRPVQDGSRVLKLQAPMRALDAALVPMSVTMTGPARDAGRVKALYLVIDANPSPLAAHFIFGPVADPHEIRLRVRVNDYTEVHAVAEMADGTLYGVEDFVKAAGGCSAPAGASAAAALKGIGEMKLRLLGSYDPGKPLQAQLLIRHPNFNGMQMDQVTRYYTPARFIDRTDVTYNGAEVFRLDSGISLSTNPAITFGFVPKAGGELKVVAHDSSHAVFVHSFAVPARSS